MSRLFTACVAGGLSLFILCGSLVAWETELEWARSFDGTYLPLHVRKPASDGPHPAVLFLFGGLGGKAWPDRPGGLNGPVPSHFFSQGYVACVADYRRYHFFGNEVEDVLAAYFHLQSMMFVQLLLQLDHQCFQFVSKQYEKYLVLEPME